MKVPIRTLAHTTRPAVGATKLESLLGRSVITAAAWKAIAPGLRGLPEESAAHLTLLKAYASASTRFDPLAAEEAHGILNAAGYSVPPREGGRLVASFDVAHVVQANAAAPDAHFERLVGLLGRGKATEQIGVVDVGFAANDVLDDNLATAAERLAREGQPLGRRLGRFSPAQQTEGAEHGTHVAGIATAGTPRLKARLFAVPVDTQADLSAGRATGADPKKAVLKGLTLAAAQAKTVNLSMESFFTVAEQRSLWPKFEQVFARHPDTVFVVGAGNDFFELGTGAAADPRSLAELVKAPNVIVVGASRAGGGLWAQGSAGSNFGKKVDVAALGSNVVSASGVGGLSMRSGTSMATPRVSNLVAKARLLDPSLGAAQLKQLVMSAVDRSANWSNSAAQGTVNLERALTAVGVRALMQRDGLGFDVALTRLAVPAADRAEVERVVRSVPSRLRGP